MTVDTEKMKALALAATQGKRRWWPARDGDHDYAQIAVAREHIAQVRIMSITEADLNLFVATDPATVLELIAEVERLRTALAEAGKGSIGPVPTVPGLVRPGVGEAVPPVERRRYLDSGME